jgi:geranylgeranylglycerol-phosphate geranylgeranyltransferase
MDRLRGFISITRPINSIMMGLAIIVGVLITGGYSKVSIPILILSWFTGFSLSSAAMVINDYFDREIDLVNEPTRPIPSGAVKPLEAIVYSLALSAAGIIAASLTNPIVLIVAAASWCIMMAYSVWGKKTGFPGNLLVSICIALPFLYGGILSSRIEASILFSILAFLTNTGREITKGIVDIEGDRLRGVNTLAVSFGAEIASQVASVFYISGALASILPIILNQTSIWYIPPVIVTDVGLLFGTYSLLRDPSRETSRKVKIQTLYWMLFGLIAFAAGSLIN